MTTCPCHLSVFSSLGLEFGGKVRVNRPTPIPFHQVIHLFVSRGHQGLFSGANICPDPRQRPLAKFEPHTVSQFGKMKTEKRERRKSFHFCGVFIGFKNALALSGVIFSLGKQSSLITRGAKLKGAADAPGEKFNMTVQNLVVSHRDFVCILLMRSEASGFSNFILFPL